MCELVHVLMLGRHPEPERAHDAQRQVLCVGRIAFPLRTEPSDLRLQTSIQDIFAASVEQGREAVGTRDQGRRQPEGAHMQTAVCISV